jgi:hypothetical protein
VRVARRTVLGVVLVVVLVAVTSACTSSRRPGPGTERVPLPPAVGVLRFAAARGPVVGLWAKADVYSTAEAVAVVEGVAASVTHSRS